MKRKIITLALGIVAAALAVLAYGWFRDNRLPNVSAAAELFVTPEMTADDVLEELKGKGVIKNPKRLEVVFRKKRVAEYLTPGYYYINSGNTSVYLARMLNNGWQSPVRLTLSGSMRKLSDISRRIGNQMYADSASVQACLNDRAFLDSLGFTPSNVMAMFIPDTYEVYWTASPKEIMRKYKAAYDAFWTDENIARAKSLGLSRMEVSILASIVNAESNHVPEMPKIAGVYLNRLKIGMKLQADPTVAFCFNYMPQRILNKHLQVDSPYNTYKYAGLPPGPICVPSRASLEAVLNPDFGGGAAKAGASGCNLYFCANPDFSGTHVFARSLSEHNANARAFQAELTRRHKAKKQ